MTEILVNLEDAAGNPRTGVVTIQSATVKLVGGVTVTPNRVRVVVPAGTASIPDVSPGLALIEIAVDEYTGIFEVEVPDQSSIQLADLILGGVT